MILIDEYDAPVGHFLDDLDKAEAVRDRLSTVYSQMKNRTGDIRFLFMTGVSKFTMEHVQSDGRADVVAKHPAEVCIFELKVDEPVDQAFAQIREKGYAEPFKADTRPVWLIGLSFDSKTRRLVDFAAEELRAES